MALWKREITMKIEKNRWFSWNGYEVPLFACGTEDCGMEKTVEMLASFELRSEFTSEQDVPKNAKLFVFRDKSGNL